MDVPKDAMLLRIFFGEDDRFEQKALYEAIVLKAREMHLAGATVLRGPMGFGHSSRMHTAKVLRLSYDLPVIVEIVDTEAKMLYRHYYDQRRHVRESDSRVSLACECR